ncbi:mitochondrial splicing apparatus component-domain-containing protein [Scheffersomyces amazonensis]|uniref:mitochondrial splicing apparatus component-domain-containing protein n=1 Tax=Scheffersomyces amazonensis TaxID=1078765 RepID=UPI00315C4CC1
MIPRTRLLSLRLCHHRINGIRPLSTSYPDEINRKSLISTLSTTSKDRISKQDFPILHNSESRDGFLRYLVDFNYDILAWKYCELLKYHKFPLTNTTYILLMRLLTSSSDHQSITNAIYIYLEAMSHYKLDSHNLVQPLTSTEKYLLTRDLLKVLSKSNDFTTVYILNTIWKIFLREVSKKDDLKVLYHATYLGIMLNSGQNELAVKYFEDLLLNEPDINTNVLPISTILDKLIQDKDSDTLVTIIRMLIDHNIIVEDIQWIQILEQAVNANDYELVLLVYDSFVMRGFKDSKISIEDAIFQDLKSKDSGLNKINDQLIHQMLHTLSSNGDVQSTLSLIESHYLHKTAKGERALSKDLCLIIIDSYCNYDDNDNEIDLDIEDNNVKQVLNVLNGLVEKLQKDSTNEALTYRDICSSLSIRFWKYYTYDEHINKASIKRQEIEESIRNSEYGQSYIPRKVSNENISRSKYGNMLSNMSILNNFIHIHINYMVSQPEFNKQTITLFINCLLEHINIYQNFTAITKVLQTLYHLNSNYIVEWLDNDSFEIILNSLAECSAGKQCSVVLFNYFKNNNIPLHHHHYAALISANLRGNVHNGLQYFLYHYLKDYGIHTNMLKSVESIKEEIIANSATAKLLNYIESNPRTVPSVEELDDFWINNNLCLDPTRIGKEEEENIKLKNRKYYRDFDVRDSEVLVNVLNR